jgi:2-polyprenyl-3-methyl-5-hydroxy-6-metoxy-1,4-benzoquinol methylase
MSNYDFFNPSPFGIHTKALNLVGRNKRVLEVGCNTGQISRRLAENGCNVIGIEIDEESANIAKEYCDDILVCDVEIIEDLPYYDFDFILLLDVLEHLRSPLALLKKLKPHLKEGGSIIISLPNIANWRVRWDLLFGRFEYSELGVLDRTHLRFFNERSARALLQDAGFDTIKFDIVPTVPIFRVRASFAYFIAKLRPNFFAVQFLIVAERKD